MVYHAGSRSDTHAYERAGTGRSVVRRAREASWYGKQFHGRKTADGDRFSQHEMTAAHRTLPLGTKVIVEEPETEKQVEVKINDRGPYA